MTRYICVHGHAYQPPREDADSGVVERQPSAAPYHDWNERISAECYGPLGRAQVLGPDNSVMSRTNLWGAMSFDLGPTLGYWMDREAPDVAALITAGDNDSGGDAAMAHPWVHAILPLTRSRDRATILRWGMSDFRRRFGRDASGMWLPETAVDTASLEAIVDLGVTWTLLAPHQVHRREASTPDVAGDSGEFDPHEPLIIDLPSGRSITVIPYDGPLSHGIAFGGLLDDGVRLARAVADAATSGLTVMSTDIESFGHHHRFGEMALAKAVQEWASMPDVELTTPAAYLRHAPATRRGRLVERSSWSCAHGIERWRSNCGCRFSEVEHQDQQWRRPLRDLLDSVADLAERIVDDHAAVDLIDPWAARDAYGEVLSASPVDRARAEASFVADHAAAGGDALRALQWMQAEALRLEAWSSCAWFFDSPDRIETVQTLQQARAAVIRLGQLSGVEAIGWLDQQIQDCGLSATFAAADVGSGTQ